MEKGVAAVDRALAILNAFMQSTENQLSLAELAKLTGFYKSTILRLCESLQKADYLVRDDEGNFRLGPASLILGSRYQDTFDLGEVIMPALRALSHNIGESSSFYIQEGDRRVCLHRVNSTQHQILHFLKEGTSYPVFTGASGQIFQAFTASQTEASDEVRRSMVAVSLRQRVFSETGAVAVPVFGIGNKLAGTLGVVGPINRFTPENLNFFQLELLKTAESVSKQLGGHAELFQVAIRQLSLTDRS